MPINIVITVNLSTLDTYDHTYTIDVDSPQSVEFEKHITPILEQIFDGPIFKPVIVLSDPSMAYNSKFVVSIEVTGPDDLQMFLRDNPWTSSFQ